MPWTPNILVVGSQTAGSPELIAALRARNDACPTTFTLVMPAVPGTGSDVASRRLDAALARMRAAGLQVGGRVAGPDPMAAAIDAWDPATFDEVVVATLPSGSSRWLAISLPRRLERRLGVSVEHVEGSTDWLTDSMPAHHLAVPAA